MNIPKNKFGHKSHMIVKLKADGFKREKYKTVIYKCMECGKDFNGDPYRKRICCSKHCAIIKRNKGRTGIKLGSLKPKCVLC